MPKARSEATRVLLAILPCADKAALSARRRVFIIPWRMADDCTRQILDAVYENREVLRNQDVGHLIDRLKETPGA